MSLINQVLKDLEHRQISDTPEPQVIMQNVRYVPVRAVRKRSPVGMISLLVLAVTLISTASYYFIWYRHGDQTKEGVIATAPTVTVVTPQPIITAVTSSVTPPVVQQTTPIIDSTPITENTQAAATLAVEEKPIKAARRNRAKKKTMAPVVEDEVIISAVTNAVSKQAVPLAPAQSAAIAYQSAYDLVSQNRLREAETLLRNALIDDPTLTTLRELLTGLYIKGGRWVEASEVLTTGLQVTPDHTPFIKLQARTLMQLNQDQRAVDVLIKFAPVVSSDPEHHALLAALYQRQHNHQAAVKTYTEVLKVQPNAGVWWVGLAISLDALGKQAEAQAAYNQARATGSLVGDVARFTDNRIQVLKDLRLSNE